MPTRRQVLIGASSWTAAGLLTAGAAPAPVGTVFSGRKVRIGVVGGNFGTQFSWHEHPDCTVAAVSDLRPERRALLSKVYRCEKTYESLEMLIQDPNLDAVAVFTPAPDHVRHCTAVMKAGKHVISAVPAAMSIDECHQLVDTVKSTGQTYMMAETSYYHQAAISARRFLKEGKFGAIFCIETEYHHPGLESLFFEGKERTWRHGFPPLHYPTHCTGLALGVTGERLVTVSAVGWGDDDPILKDNVYKNPFWNGTAFFKSNKGTAVRVAVYWKGALRGTERASWYGEKMSLFEPHPNGLGPIILRAGNQTEKDDAGFVRQMPAYEPYAQPQWWKSEMLPEPLRHNSGHDGSHTFLTHEFISALKEGRRPAVSVYEAVAYTAPGIVAHQSALKGGEQMGVPQFEGA